MSLIRTPDEITSDWLSETLGRPGLELAGTERIGTGQMSQNHRVTFNDDGALATVVVKLASDDATSRGTGVGMGAYYREIAFYQRLAAQLGDSVPTCHFAAYDPAEGWFTLVMDEVVGARQGDQVAGCSPAAARLALLELARIHRPVLNDLHIGMEDYLNQPNPLTQELMTALLPGLLERYGDRIAPDQQEVFRRFVDVAGAWEEEHAPPFGLVHGDYRLDNLLFTEDHCTVVDWQTLRWGPALTDVSYFLGTSLTVADRRAHEEELVRAYHAELGAPTLSWEDCWREYRRQTFTAVIMNLVAPMVVQQTERGDQMFLACIERCCQQVLDLDALSLLPRPGTPRAPLAVRAADEGRHAPGPEPLWNESWYFDAVSDDGTVGLYLRLGRLPNQGVALYTACVTGPGRPSVMVVNAEAPLPPMDDDCQAIDTGDLRSAQTIEEPLQRWRIILEGTGEAHADHAAPLRSERGDPVTVTFDLMWETDGTPYQWRQATRYEIPCRVSGTVRVGEEEIAFAGPGQRDHSWGARDWWATDWMWCGLHLEDGTHTHCVGLPQRPGIGVGYVQKGGVVSEVASVTATETVADDGLVADARIVSGPPELDLAVQPVAFGALRLDAPDGRVSLFPRAMVRLTAADGRSGTGWVEWNRVQR